MLKGIPKNALFGKVFDRVDEGFVCNTLQMLHL